MTRTTRIPISMILYIDIYNVPQCVKIISPKDERETLDVCCLCITSHPLHTYETI